MTVKKKYEALRKRHGLPPFGELDTEFEISTIESQSFLLREIRRRMVDKLRDISSMAGQALQPDTNLADLYESRVLDEEEKKELFEIYKKLMAADRLSAEAAIAADEKADAEYIKSTAEEWKGLKPRLARLVKKLREAWGKDTEQGEAAGYMG